LPPEIPAAKSRLTVTSEFMTRYLDPKNDLVFKKIFGEHLLLLKDFLNALLLLPEDGQIIELSYLPAEQVSVTWMMRLLPMPPGFWWMKCKSCGRLDGVVANFARGRDKGLVQNWVTVYKNGGRKVWRRERLRLYFLRYEQLE